MGTMERLHSLVAWMDGKEGLAAWAQFTGAMIALSLALGQGAAARRRGKAADVAAAMAGYVLVNNAAGVALQMHRDLVAAGTRDARIAIARRILGGGQLQEFSHALTSFDMTRLPHEAFVDALATASMCLISVRRHVEIAADGGASPESETSYVLLTLQKAASDLSEPLNRMRGRLPMFYDIRTKLRGFRFNQLLTQMSR